MLILSYIERILKTENYYVDFSVKMYEEKRN